MGAGNDNLFFEIAAGLIPVLVFGGLLTERLKPGAWGGRGQPGAITAGVIAALLMVVPLLAEATAIAVALGTPPDEFDTWLVAGTLTLATAALSLSLAWPWLVAIERHVPVGRYRLNGRVVVVVLVGVLAIRTASLLRDAVDLHASEVSLTRQLELTREFKADQDRIYDLQHDIAKAGERRKLQRLEREQLGFALRASTITLELMADELENSPLLTD